MCIGGKHLHCYFKPMTNSSFISENPDQELSLDDLQNVNGGVFLLLLSALMPGVANAPGEGDDIYMKPSLWEIAKTGSTLGAPDGTQGGCTNVAPGPDGKGCTDRNLPF